MIFIESDKVQVGLVKDIYFTLLIIHCTGSFVCNSRVDLGFVIFIAILWYLYGLLGKYALMMIEQKKLIS